MFRAALKNEPMATDTMQNETPSLDHEDIAILKELQTDSTQSMERIAKRVGLSKSAVWNRMQRMTQAGVIERQAAIVDPCKAGLNETFFVTIRTAQHTSDWSRRFHEVVKEMPQITEAHRLAGTSDYLLKVQVPSTSAFDAFYQTLVSRVDLFDVSSSLSMETMKKSSVLPLG